MTDVLELRAPSGTHTIPRHWDNTETRDIHPKQPERAQLPGPDDVESQVGIVRFVSGTTEHSTAPSPPPLKASLVSTPENPADAISEAPGADLPARLRHLLPALPRVAPGEEQVTVEVLKRLFQQWILTGSKRVPNPTLTQTRPRYDCFRSKLIATLLDEPIEDGVTHPAEHVIDEALLTHSSECLDWLSWVLIENYDTRPSLSAAIVRCIGSLEYDQVGHWGMRVADDALQHKHVEVREAAVRALEAWGGCEALGMLRNHGDSVAWMNEYVRQVIIDLSGTTS